MIIYNSTDYHLPAALEESVSEFPIEDLVVQLRHCPRGSRRYISGTYYRKTRGFENGGLIRIRINRHNRYPLKIQFKTSQYERKKNLRGEEVVYQKLLTVEIHNAQDLITAIFLHEFSHYLDHIQGLNGKYKQTKADKFAISKMEKLGIINGTDHA